MGRLSPGTPLRIIGQYEGQVWVRLPGGSEGWVILAAVERGETAVTPPTDFIYQSDGSDLTEWAYLPTVPYFSMGSSSYDAEFTEAAEQPIHPISLSPFWIQRTEVSNAAYTDCVAAEACSEPTSLVSNTRPDYYTNAEFADYPVIFVTQPQAQAYCEWIGGRLSTEAEWEYAVRYPTLTYYTWGNGASRAIDNPDLANFGKVVGDTMPVYSYLAGITESGLFNMNGNVLKPVDMTAYKRTGVKGLKSKTYDASANKAVPGVPFGMMGTTGRVGEQRVAILELLVCGDTSQNAPSAEMEKVYKQVGEKLTETDLALFDAGFSLVDAVRHGVNSCVVRLPKNCTFGKTAGKIPPRTSKKGPTPSRHQAEVVRPLERKHGDNLLPASKPTQTHTVFKYLAAILPPIRSGFWDRAVKPTYGRLLKYLKKLVCRFPVNFLRTLRLRHIYRLDTRLSGSQGLKFGYSLPESKPHLRKNKVSRSSEKSLRSVLVRPLGFLLEDSSK